MSNKPIKLNFYKCNAIWPHLEFDRLYSSLFTNAEDCKKFNLCEMKFCEDDFSITATYDKNLRNKISTFQEETHCKSSLHLTLVTTYGLKLNEYAGRVQNLVTMDALFYFC